MGGVFFLTVEAEESKEVHGDEEFSCLERCVRRVLSMLMEERNNDQVSQSLDFLWLVLGLIPWACDVAARRRKPMSICKEGEGIW